VKTVDFKGPVVPTSKQENPEKNENNRNNPKKSVTDKNPQNCIRAYRAAANREKNEN